MDLTLRTTQNPKGGIELVQCCRKRTKTALFLHLRVDNQRIRFKVYVYFFLTQAIIN